MAQTKGFLGYSDPALVPSNVLLPYAGDDADATFRCYKLIRPWLKEQELLGYLRDPMMLCSRNLTLAGIYGMRVHRPRAEALGEQLRRWMGQIELDILDIAGEALNLRSPRDKSKLLFEICGLPTREVPKTPTGMYSTDQDTLQYLAEKYQDPVVMRMQEYSRLNKLQTTYVDPGVLKWLDPEDRIHTTFRIAQAVTGRITSSEPPLATIPRDKEYRIGGKQQELSLRAMYVAGAGNVLTYADVSQAELAVLAIVAGEEKMIQVFKRGGDIHAATGVFVMGLTEEEAKNNKEKRALAKNLNFGAVYGGSAEGTAAAAGVDVELVRQNQERFWTTYQDLARFLRGIAQVALRERAVPTPFGRVRRFPYIDFNNERQVAHVERQAKNVIAQNGAAEVVFRALNRICQRFEKYKMKSWVRNLVYDSIQTEGPKKEAKDVRAITIEEMCRPVPQLDNYQFSIDIGQAEVWSDAEHGAEKIRPG